MCVGIGRDVAAADSAADDSAAAPTITSDDAIVLLQLLKLLLPLLFLRLGFGSSLLYHHDTTSDCSHSTQIAGNTALHLASARRHKEIVIALKVPNTLLWML